MTLVWKSGYSFDSDASTYIDAVETADGQALETGVRIAINDFVLGCKQDGIWNAIKASCILAGARTLTGALVPLVGSAPTNNNFVSADYDRETGLKGNGSTKYLDSNRADDDDPLNDFHFSVNVTTTAIGASNEFAIGGITTAGNNGSFIYNGSGTLFAIVRTSSSATFSVAGAGASTGFIGASRSGASTSQLVANQTFYENTTQSSTASATHNNLVFCRGVNGTPSSFTAARLSFYSIGESLDLALLDTRVSNLMTAIGAAIP